MSAQINAADLLNLLEAPEIQTAEEIKQLIVSNLHDNKEAWLLNGVLDYYLVSHSERCLEILALVRDPHDKQLFDRLLDFLKGSHKLQALTVIGYLVSKQPPWLHKITQHNLISQVLKVLKNEVDVPILMSGLLTITSLLPLVPVTIQPMLPEIFDVFSRVANFNLKKPGNVPDVYLLHLHVGLYSLFHRLYGMYPSHFLTFLRSCYSRKENKAVFQSTIEPMLERVRMHPLLIKAPKDKEGSRERWKQKEVHDIIAECAHLSIDLIEGSAESEPLIADMGAESKMSMADVNGRTQNIADTIKSALSLAMLDASQAGASSILGSVDPQSLWSPGMVCGMTTPPPPNSTTSITQADAQISAACSQTGTKMNTPRNTPFIPESPLDVEKPPLTPGVYHPYQHDVPLTPGGKRVSALGHAQASSGAKMSVTGMSGQPGSGTVPQSPLKFDFPSNPPMHAQKMQAIRKLTFQQQLSDEKVDIACDVGSRMSHETAATTVSNSDVKGEQKTKANVSMKSKIEPLQKSELTTQAIKSDNDLAPQDSRTEVPLKAADSETDIKSTKKRPPPLKNFSSNEGFDFANSPCDSNICGASESNADFLSSEDVKVEIASSNKPEGIEKSQSGPSLKQLPDIIDSLQKGHLQPQEGGVDEEVEGLTGSKDSIGVDSSGSSTEEVIHQSNLTAQSVKAFMKGVNRIRFNSMNVTTNVPIQVPVKGVRSRSCPDLDQAEFVKSSVEASSPPGRPRSNSGTVAGMSKAPSDPEMPPVTGISAAFTSSLTTITTTTAATFTAAHSIAEEDEEDLVEVDIVRGNPIGEFDINDPHCMQTVEQVKKELLDAAMNDLRNMFPYYRLLHLALPFAPFIKCSKCRAEEDPDKTRNAAAYPLFSTFSPPDLLDRHILLGANLHGKWADIQAKQKKLFARKENLSNVSLPSQPHISWTHLGGLLQASKGLPPAEEVEILQGQVQLLHNQLMYERQKRDIYAKRNRRLLGRITKTTALEEQNAAMVDQMRLQENEVQNLQVSIKLLKSQMAETKTAKEHIDKEKTELARTKREEIDRLVNEKKQLQTRLDEKSQENVALKRDLQGSKSQCFNLKQEMNCLQVKADFATDLQFQVERLNKELLLMGELQQKYQQRLMSQASAHQTRPETQFFLEALQHELAATKANLDQKTRDHDAHKANMTSLEESVRNKDSVILDLKRALDHVKNMNREEIKAVEEKYAAQKRVQMALCGQILELRAQLDLATRTTLPEEAGASTVLSNEELLPTSSGSSTRLTSPTPRSTLSPPPGEECATIPVEEAKECRETPPSSTSPTSPTRYIARTNPSAK